MELLSTLSTSGSVSWLCVSLRGCPRKVGRIHWEPSFGPPPGRLSTPPKLCEALGNVACLHSFPLYFFSPQMRCFIHDLARILVTNELFLRRLPWGHGSGGFNCISVKMHQWSQIRLGRSRNPEIPFVKPLGSAVPVWELPALHHDSWIRRN